MRANSGNDQQNYVERRGDQRDTENFPGSLGMRVSVRVAGVDVHNVSLRFENGVIKRAIRGGVTFVTRMSHSVGIATGAVQAESD
jgi:hypothetical protein